MTFIIRITGKKENRQMNTKIVKIVCPHKERMEIYFEEGAVLLPGEAGSSCYLADSKKLSWLARSEEHTSELQSRI